MDLHEQLGAFERSDDRIDMRFERHYPRSIETVWSALTDPVRLNDWMGAAHVEPRVGGRYELMLDGANPMTGRILIWEPPHVLESPRYATNCRGTATASGWSSPIGARRSRIARSCCPAGTCSSSVSPPCSSRRRRAGRTTAGANFRRSTWCNIKWTARGWIRDR
jgi:hypothetical protein